MPALVLFGKPTFLGGDDLQFMCLLVMLFRTIQLVLLVPVLTFFIQITDDAEECKASDETSISTVAQRGTGALYAYWCLSFALATISLIVEFLIRKTSLLGTPCTPEERSALKMLCFVKLIPLNWLRMITFAMAVAVSLLIVEDVCRCEGLSRGTENNEDCDTYGTLGTSFTILRYSHYAEVAAVGVHFWLFGCRPYTKKLICFWRRWRSDSAGQDSGSAWKVCCRCCCSLSSILTCCLLGGAEASLKADFSDVSLALTDFFSSGGHLDIVVSDIIAALVLLYREQREQRDAQMDALRRATNGSETVEEGFEVGEESTTNESPSHASPRRSIVGVALQREDGVPCYKRCRQVILSPDVPLDLQAIAEGARFMQLSIAIYGYLMYILEYTHVAPCVLVADSLCCRRSCHNANIVGDNICGCNEIALLREAGMTPDCIAYVSFQKSLVLSPYCIVLDHEWKSVVVAIRGTLSIEDAVKDLSITPVSLKECGERFGFDGEHHYAHSGMLATAECLVDDLNKQGILEGLVYGDSCRYPGYSLKITGHSLGGGLAALVGLFLRSKYPRLSCVCFEPPCMISPSLSTDDFVTSFITGTDIVPRLSLASLEHLRDDVLAMVARIKVAKREALSRTTRVSSAAHRRTSIPKSDFSRKLDLFRAHQDDTKLEHEASQVGQIPPGRLVHLFRTQQNGRSFFSIRDPKHSDDDDADYKAVYATYDDLSEIQLSNTLVTDHTPGKVLGVLGKVASDFGLESPYFLVPTNTDFGSKDKPE